MPHHSTLRKDEADIHAAAEMKCRSRIHKQNAVFMPGGVRQARSSRTSRPLLPRRSSRSRYIGTAPNVNVNAHQEMIKPLSPPMLCRRRFMRKQVQQKMRSEAQRQRAAERCAKADYATKRRQRQQVRRKEAQAQSAASARAARRCHRRCQRYAIICSAIDPRQAAQNHVDARQSEARYAAMLQRYARYGVLAPSLPALPQKRPCRYRDKHIFFYAEYKGDTMLLARRSPSSIPPSSHRNMRAARRLRTARICSVARRNRRGAEAHVYAEQCTRVSPVMAADMMAQRRQASASALPIEHARRARKQCAACYVGANTTMFSCAAAMRDLFIRYR